MFTTNTPVARTDFYDRVGEVERLADAFERARTGAPRWLCIVGPRKIGKTSLVSEAADRHRAPGLAFVLVDAFEERPLTVELFRTFAYRVVDALLGADLPASAETLALAGPTDLTAALFRHPEFARLSGDVQVLLARLPELELRAPALRAILDLPERIAETIGCHVVVAWDEFQELAQLAGGKRGLDPFPLMRSRWQHHRRVGYVVSGSERSTLLELATSSASPFFQHFQLLELGPFPREDAVRMLVELAPPDTPIPPALAGKAWDVLGGHPFYLQLLGEELVREGPPLDDVALRVALQRLLFSRTGRLSLYLERRYHRRVGRSTYLAAVLDALSRGPLRASEISTAIGAPSGATIRYIERLGDAVQKTEDGAYQLDDPVFGKWLAWRRPGGTVLPMRLLGDEAEQQVASALARLGFELVYQSRGSRGAFDLLAIRGVDRLGVQVKRARTPVSFTLEEWSRLEADGARFGWRWVIAAADDQDGVRYLDPSRARVRRTVRLVEEAVIPNLLLWLQQVVPRS